MSTAFERAYKRTVSNMTVARRVAGYACIDDDTKVRTGGSTVKEGRKSQKRTKPGKSG